MSTTLIIGLSLIAGVLGGGLLMFLVLRLRLHAVNEKLRAEREELLVARTNLASHSAEIERLKGEKAERDGQLSEERGAKEELIRRLSEAETRKDAERKIFEKAQQELSARFENLANKIFDDKSRKFADHNKEQLGHLLNPLKQNIVDFRKKVEDSYDKESKDRSALHSEIKRLAELNMQVSKEADNLTKALKGDNKIMGNWGEHALERILEMSGLQAGREYETQVHAHSAEGKLYRPDVVVHLPENRDIIIDAKVSLLAYERYCSAETDEDRGGALKEHLNSLRGHVKSLSSKNYEYLQEIRSLDYVLIFVPIEAAFITAIKEDPQLVNDALSQNIMLVCPSTLLVTLRTIANIWRYEQQNQHANTIAEKAGALYDKFVTFVETMQKVQGSINRASDDCGAAIKLISTGRGNLIGRVQEFKKLGVQSKKHIPETLLGDETLPEPTESTEPTGEGV